MQWSRPNRTRTFSSFFFFFLFLFVFFSFPEHRLPCSAAATRVSTSIPLECVPRSSPISFPSAVPTFNDQNSPWLRHCIQKHERPLCEGVRADLYTKRGNAFRPFLLPVSLRIGHLYLRRWGRGPLLRREERARQKEYEGGRKNYDSRVKGKSTNSARRSHYRLGFDCSGSAGTGATRYTLYSASVRFFEIYYEKEPVYG